MMIQSEFSWRVRQSFHSDILWMQLSRDPSRLPRNARQKRYNSSSVFSKLPTSEWIWAIALLFRSGKTVKRPPRTVKPFVRGETRVCTKKCGGGGTERNLIVDFVFLSEPSVFFFWGAKIVKNVSSVWKRDILLASEKNTTYCDELSS